MRWGLSKAKAIRNKKEWTISRDDYPVPLYCPVLAIPLDYSDNDHKPTLDRHDNLKGYITGNVYVISMKANRLKNNATIDEIRLLYKYMQKKFPLWSKAKR